MCFHYRRSHRVSFDLFSVMRLTKRQPSISGSDALLHDVGQLMGEKAPALMCLRLVLPGIEHDVSPNCVGQRVNSRGRFSRFLTCMNSNLAEVMSEARLYESARLRIQRLPGRAQASCTIGGTPSGFRVSGFRVSSWTLK